MNKPTLTEKAAAAEAARKAREAAALRANLRKRKEQAKAREDLPVSEQEKARQP